MTSSPHNASAPAASLPANIPEYLEQLRRSLAGADPALIQDALYDAEDYLRSELAENPEKSEAEVIAAVASSYGAPEEVADIYRDTEVKVQTALKPPPSPKRASLIGKFFGVAADPRTYSSLFYMMFTLATGLFYFVWILAGLSISITLSVVIVGIPFLILFFGSIRLLSLVEGRLVEVMLGERMPRRPLYADRSKPLMARIGEMFKDPRTWTSILYMGLMLPLGVSYFIFAFSALSLSLSFIAAPLMVWFGLARMNADLDGWSILEMQNGAVGTSASYWTLPLVFVVGFVLLFLTLHLARGIGKVHGLFAKHLLVKSTFRD